ncbi:type I-B CRISPR-associated protein Cas7/Cst2/DevR [Synechocystis sp. PCC 7339]|uniref:type I-B CRISPR-associated protein Cas7/Cst2/DevR n=1 Tax=unclassified Synechocystis TaxID=2640012 RepID=UPI001BAF0D65|nr:MULTISPECIES: type I-B CRISPR-associated protein Cas7/Cst2/DevR [unclassified Synechocystis]QUS60090.1 type I-B CRISPR-associated protein Cas7/Cst2/DevR [Synechocystis sp. PCC 7338]UAJ72463.1 type I-B CRISPR-associated protein Cas7/Cst2/DevR [Synechocystis sp. PCC 7339]
MTQHLFANIVTPTAVAANNRGEGDGSTLSTLQKITRGIDQYTTVSAEAIRWAYREYFQQHHGDTTNRSFDPDADRYEFKTEVFNAEQYIDDDLFGYMDAKKGSDNKDATTKRRGALEISRAISLDPYWGDIAFGSKGGEKNKTSIHQTEVHCTAYQYTLAVTPSHLKKIERAEYLLEAIAAIRHVGGNHSRFLYEFRPESIVLRVTEDPSPWIMGCFERVGDSIGCAKLVRLVEVGDIPASELIVGGEIVQTPYSDQLKKLGVTVQGGVKSAIAEAKKHLSIVVP